MGKKSEGEFDKVQFDDFIFQNPILPTDTPERTKSRWDTTAQQKTERELVAQVARDETSLYPSR